LQRYFGYLDDMFISFEGLDHSGKTTQAKLLVDRLEGEGRKVLFLREPGGTRISEKIRDLLLDRQHLELTQLTELFLFSAARAQLVRQVIVPALRSGTIVVCDRFADSTTTYQGYGRGLPLNDVNAINRIATAGTTPDITVLVDVETEEIFRRRSAAGISADRMEAGSREFFDTIRSAYRSLALSESGRFFVVDGMRPVNVIHNDVWHLIETRLP
jgi:dTMP kinase